MLVHRILFLPINGVTNTRVQDGNVCIRYASICAMESTTKVDDEQWLAYWIIYSFITLFEMAAENVLYW